MCVFKLCFILSKRRLHFRTQMLHTSYQNLHKFLIWVQSLKMKPPLRNRSLSKILKSKSIKRCPTCVRMYVHFIMYINAHGFRLDRWIVLHCWLFICWCLFAMYDGAFVPVVLCNAVDRLQRVQDISKHLLFGRSLNRNVNYNSKWWNGTTYVINRSCHSYNSNTEIHPKHKWNHDSHEAKKSLKMADAQTWKVKKAINMNYIFKSDIFFWNIVKLYYVYTYTKQILGSMVGNKGQ